jgi:hypothetical protein
MKGTNPYPLNAMPHGRKEAWAEEKSANIVLALKL